MRIKLFENVRIGHSTEKDGIIPAGSILETDWKLNNDQAESLIAREMAEETEEEINFSFNAKDLKVSEEKQTTKGSKKNKSEGEQSPPANIPPGAKMTEAELKALENKV